MSTMAETRVRITGGVDTHRDVNVAAALDERGALLGTSEFATTTVGYRQLLAFLERFGDVDRVGVEGTGTYGAGLARHLLDAGVPVIEVDRPNRQRRRRAGKSDTTDAISAARAAQSGEAATTAKARNGNVEKLRVLRVARRSISKDRVRAINQLRALIVTAPPELRDQLAGLTAIGVAQAAARFRVADPTSDLGALKYAMRSLGRRAEALRAEAKELDKILRTLITDTAPDLIARPGIGVDAAGALLVAAGDNPERMRTEASFAKLCAAAPMEASSGLVTRHRLSRAGNREANSALFMIIINRMSRDEATQAYVNRRVAEGKSKLEIIRCLKRYVAREVYPLLLQIDP
jgi:transposase